MREQFKNFISQHWLLSEPWHYHVYRMPLMFFAMFLVSGVWIGARIGDVPLIGFGLAAGAIGCAAIALHLRGSRHWAGLLILMSSLFLGIYASRSSQPMTADGLSRIASREWQPCAMRVRILAAAVWQPNPNHRPLDPKSQAWKTQWNVECLAIRDQQVWRPVQSSSRLTMEGRVSQYLPGDVLEVYGQFRKLSGAANPGGFDFAKQAALEGQFVSLRAESLAQLKLIDSRWGWHTLARLRGLAIRGLDKSLSRWVTNGRAPLAAALVFGQRQQVEWQDQQELMATGTLHMLSISGLHVEIVAAVLLAICLASGAGQSVTFFVLVLFTWAYAGLSGAEPPVVRAAVQVTIFAFARWMGARTRIGNLLGGAAIVIVLLRSSNIDNVGVQLSFLAVATIGFFITTIRQHAARDRLQAVIDETLPVWRLWIRAFTRKVIELTYLSFWITLFTCPLVWTHFHVISPIAIVLNVLIAIPLTVSLLSGLCTGLLGWIAPVGWIGGQLCGASLSLIASAVEWGESVPMGHFWLPAPELWWTTTFYLFIFVWLIVFGRQQLKILGALLLIWLLFAMAPWATGPRGLFPSLPSLAADPSQTQELRCTFLSVGHGTSVMIELPGGEVWLYDAGHLGAAERSHQEIAAALWDLKTARIQRLILSHADSDHYNATLGLLERFAIGSVTSTPQFWANEDRDVQAVIEQLKEQQCDLQTWAYPEQLSSNEVQFQVLHPSPAWRGSNDNADSLCLLIEFAGKRILLPGDLEGAGLSQLVTLPGRPCHVVMAPHHGSTTHDPTNLLLWCQPEAVVISGSARAVRSEVIEVFSRIPSILAITHRDGAIQVRIQNDGKLSVWRWDIDHWLQLGT